MTDNPIVEIEKLTSRFDDKTVIDGLSLNIPRGGVYGLIGEKGAGKSTVINHILGLKTAESGSIKVFGLNPVDHRNQLAKCVRDARESAYCWIDRASVQDITSLAKSNATHDGISWDESYAEELRESFDLAPDLKWIHMSRYQRSRIGLLTILPSRPDLLILGGPLYGRYYLDPSLIRDVVCTIIRRFATDGRTVLFSSHFTDEVELVADRIGIIHQGKIVSTSSKERIDTILE